jgi:tetratricopeptide (TPR) repeat protein
LLSSLLAKLPALRRRAVLEGSSEEIRRLADSGRHREPPDIPPEDSPLAHALFTLIAGVTSTQPVLVAVDDLHWVDQASLEFLGYLLQRIGELPVSVIMTSRPGARFESTGALERLATHPLVRIETLTPLGEDAVLTLARRTLGPRADERLARTSLEVTTGNPFYLGELLSELAAEPGLAGEQLADRARELAPDAVIRSLRVRVGRLGPQATALAQAVAVLDDDAPLGTAATIAGLTIDEAAVAADRLAAVEILLDREPLRFVHPLVRHAIERDIPSSLRSRQHLEAARLEHAAGQPAQRVAGHLLRARADGDAWVVAQLRAAAELAQQGGYAATAERYLRRALAEPPTREIRVEVLAELGRAQAATGDPAAEGTLAAAAHVTSDRRHRAELTAARGQALYDQGRHAEAAQAFEQGLTQLPCPEHQPIEDLHDLLQTGFAITAAMVPDLRAAAIRRSSELRAGLPVATPSPGQRLRLAQAALHSAWAGEREQKVAALIEQAWDDGRLLEIDTADGFGWDLIVAATRVIGRYEHALELTEAVGHDARRRASPLAVERSRELSGLPLLGQGNVEEALGQLELSAGGPSKARRCSRTTLAAYALALIEAGELDQAEEALLATGPLVDHDDFEDALRRYARAELPLAQGRPQEALVDALATGEAIGARWVADDRPRRAVAVPAALAVGDRARALMLAREALELAEHSGVLHGRIRARRLLGICEQGAAGLAQLQRAVSIGNGGPARLETIRALLELGAALRRGNRRAEAREPLQQAADLARRGGARTLYERARTELAATGARPRRELLLSGPESLTPSERRVAELAAAGRTNARSPRLCS